MKVMTFGTFDIFHQGHKSYLEQAKQLGTELIVVIARDQTVLKVKKNPAIHNEQERMSMVKQQNIANKVVLGDLNNYYKLIVEHKPNIIALGYDQQSFTENLNTVIMEHKLNCKIIRLNSFHPNKFKTSIIKNVYSK